MAIGTVLVLAPGLYKKSLPPVIAPVLALNVPLKVTAPAKAVSIAL